MTPLAPWTGAFPAAAAGGATGGDGEGEGDGEGVLSATAFQGFGSGRRGIATLGIPLLIPETLSPKPNIYFYLYTKRKIEGLLQGTPRFVQAHTSSLMAVGSGAVLA